MCYYGNYYGDLGYGYSGLDCGYGCGYIHNLGCGYGRFGYGCYCPSYCGRYGFY
uniref:Uncharacterized protein n=1 Tax=Catagonus wagneri TaxID=51154 RepID=A0A8C3X416_9CETA